MLEDKIKARVEELKKERENFVLQANSTVNAMSVAIVELEKLLVGSNSVPNPEEDLNKKIGQPLQPA